MAEDAAKPPPPLYPDFEEVEYSVYGFECDEWEEIPYPTGPDWFTDDERDRRNENADQYEKNGGTPTAWARYLALGFFGFEDCSKFEEIWDNFDADPLAVHKVIWYQFTYFLDREFDIPDKLYAWASEYSREYILYHDPELLPIDTFAPMAQWKRANIDADTSMEDAESDEDADDTVGWNLVPLRGRRKNSPERALDEMNTPTVVPAKEVPTKQGVQNPYQQKNDFKTRYDKVVKPASQPPNMETVQEDEEVQDDIASDALTIPSSKDGSIAKWSVDTQQARSAPFPTVAVNDGTHRVKIKWTIDKTLLLKYEQDKSQLNAALKKLLTSIFDDNDGMMYRWESENLTQSALVSSLSGEGIRDYVTPKIAFIKSTSQIILGVRYGFTENPHKWQNEGNKAKLLKTQKISIHISNSTTTGGTEVTAGYILLKAPNTTSTHRYTQAIRNKLPDVTPYFNIDRFRKTPMDQTIPHLVVLCGENHVTTVCQALSKLLTGKESAVFLPRYAFSAMTDDQVRDQFEFHGKWLKSLKAFQLAPIIFHLDQERIEYFNDGRVLRRSTREWAASLKLPTGESALCDVVNGTKEKKALLLAPSHYTDNAKEELRLYRLRIAPPSHREARFRDRVPDLPDEIHIQTAANLNVSFMANLLAADVWKALPESKQPPAHQGNKPGKQKKKKMKPKKPPENAWDVPLANKSDKSTGSAPAAAATINIATDETNDSGDDSTIISGTTSLGTTEDLSTASTQSLTVASETLFQAKMRELETKTKNKLKALEVTSKNSANQLSSLETKFNLFTIETSAKISKVGAEVKEVAKSLSASVDTQTEMSNMLTTIQANNVVQFRQVENYLLQNSENVDSLTDSITDIRKAMAKIFKLMKKDLGFRKQATSNRRSSKSYSTPPAAMEDDDRKPPAIDNPPGKGKGKGLNRSPPPKRPRSCDKGTAGVFSIIDGSIDNGLDDTDMKSEHSSVCDTTFNDQESEATCDDEDAAATLEASEDEGADDEYDDDGFSDSDGLPTNLQARFEDYGSAEEQEDSEFPPLPYQDDFTNRSFDVTNQTITTQHQTKPAPLDPQYTTTMGPAGAADK